MPIPRNIVLPFLWSTSGYTSNDNIEVLPEFVEEGIAGADRGGQQGVPCKQPAHILLTCWLANRSLASCTLQAPCFFHLWYYLGMHQLQGGLDTAPEQALLSKRTGRLDLSYADTSRQPGPAFEPMSEDEARNKKLMRTMKEAGLSGQM
eukprot:scaffold85579_cov36-Tisochrysis_lutea.AAC.3